LLLYRLASSERTLPVVSRLVAAGERSDPLDNRQLSALAYAMTKRDHVTATRLLKLGARPVTPIDTVGMPAALIPVVSGDYEGIRLMRKFGVDYETLRFNGTSAVDMARRSGDRRLLDALSPRSQSS